MRKIKMGKKREVAMAVILVTAVFVLMWVIRPWKTRPTFSDEKSSVGQVEQVRRLLDGVMVEKGKENPPLVGVMIENMVEAQPISGIADAALVFEALTEANITRFLAYFVIPSPPIPLPRGEGDRADARAGEGNIEIGPVRSARPYFLDWAAEFNTLFAHVGSSPAAYELLHGTKDSPSVEGLSLVDLDQWYKSEYFFVKDGRAKPHHIYMNTELLRKAYQDLVISTKSRGRGTSGEISHVPDRQGVRSLADARDDGLASFEPWKFKNDAPPDLRGNVVEIAVGYTPPYEVRWQYDKFENHYKRMQWASPTSAGGSSVGQGGVHTTAEGREIIAKNIAVVFQEMEILDEIGRKKFATIGEGKGLVFQDGRVVVGTWKKPSAQERMRFYNVQGTEVEFNGGMSWVEIVPEGYEVKY